MVKINFRSERLNVMEEENPVSENVVAYDVCNSVLVEAISVNGDNRVQEQQAVCEQVKNNEETIKSDECSVFVSEEVSEGERETVSLIPIPLTLVTLSYGVQALVNSENFLNKESINFSVVPVEVSNENNAESDDESGDKYCQQEVQVSEEVEIAMEGEEESHLKQDLVTYEESTVPVTIETKVIQLENGRLAYIHDKPQVGCQMVKLEDGTSAYITLSEETVVQEEVNLVTDRRIDNKESSLQVVEKKMLKTNFRCLFPDCGRLYSSMHHLKVHERSHTGSKPYKCTQEGCSKAFSSDYGRKAHLRTHTGEKPYHCLDPTCNKSFKTSGDLQKHTRTHTGERPFACPVSGCNRSFTTSNIRKVHIRTHTGEKPYRCTHEGCERSFASATNFKNHMRIHSGEKPFVCSWEGCQKRFTEYSSLYKHNMVHSKQKPYKCNICNHYYRQPSTLTVHKRTNHGVIEAEDGTEIVLGNVFGVTSKKFKTLATNLISFTNDKRVGGSTVVTFQEDGGEDNQIYILDGDNLEENLIEDLNEAELETSLDPLN